MQEFEKGKTLNDGKFEDGGMDIRDKAEDGTAQNASNQFTVRLGNKTYIVSVYPSETATESMETAFRKMCRREVMEG